jgi:VIT1/CCC1 family predicted Fe2+/Mn2+ transporter
MPRSCAPAVCCAPASNGSEFVRSIVFGAMDGILSTFAHVAAVAGSSLSTQVVLVLAFSNLLADAIAMGVGDFISTKAENDHIMAERQREGACTDPPPLTCRRVECRTGTRAFANVP